MSRMTLWREARLAGGLLVGIALLTTHASAQTYAPQGVAPGYRPAAPGTYARPGQPLVDNVYRVQATPETPAPSIPSNLIAPGAAAEVSDLTVGAAERGFGGGSPTLEVAEEEAAEEAEGTLLMSLLGLEDAPIQVYGWIQNSYTANPAQPANFSNFPVTPNTDANTWMGNQYYLIFEKMLDIERDFDWGFRVDNLFGNDWAFNKMAGLFDGAFEIGDFTGYDLAQAYGEVHTPFFTEGGMDWKFGRWYTLHGYEVVPAIGRPLLSVPYLFTFGQPFTHTGLMTTWHVTDKLNVYNGTTNGWDRWFDEKYKWGYMGGFSLTFGDDDRGNWTSIYSFGPNQWPNNVRPDNDFIYPGTGPGNIAYHGTNPNYNDNWRSFWTNVVSWQWTDKLTQVAELDLGIDRRIPGLNGVAPNGIQLAQTAGWQGFGNWFLYSLTDELTAVWRSEVFADPTGVRTLTYQGDNYYEQTLGLIWKPCPYIWIRPEARYDWSQFHPIYNDGVSKSQFTFGGDVIFLF